MRPESRRCSPAPITLLLLLAAMPSAATVLYYPDDRLEIARRLASEGPQTILVEVDDSVEEAIAVGRSLVAACGGVGSPGQLAALRIARLRGRLGPGASR